MIAPIQMFDVNAINSGMQNGMQRGAVNSPFTPLGQALDKTLQKYEANIQMQQKSASDANLLNTEYGLKRSLAEQEDKIKMPWKYGPDGQQLPPAQIADAGVPEFITTSQALDPSDPSKKTVFGATKKMDVEKGYPEYSNWSPVPTDSSYYQDKNKELRAKTRLEGAQKAEAANAAIDELLLQFSEPAAK